MQTRTRLNIALVGGLVVIGLLFWLAGREQAGQAPLLDRDPSAVSQVSVEAEGELRWRMARRDEGWWLEEPESGPADRERVGQLLPLLRAPVHARYPLEEVEPAQFGLDEPVLVIQVDGERLAVGDGEPVNRRRYVQRGNDDIVLVDEIVYFQFDRPGREFLDHRLLPAGAAVEAITFSGHELTRDDEGRWRLEPMPEAYQAEDNERLIENWQAARARKLSGFDGEADGAAVAVRLVDGRERRFLVLEDEEGLVLASPDTGLRYRFPAREADALLPPGNDD
ncbi:DUF4340 domain-containing protein [Gammaproteobacteria bacterium AB-CW1]|uniref:DUF4340 domain-containing protein n=1 Tax=Natronospira elongata TaxID=3110268 RepID=A0AAP6MMK0_9GAMM|nr:DUF4340 domain-containing protein [Gammaproteobacteria bacterium AB-CW1]